MLARWQPFGDIHSDSQRIRREMNRLFGRYGNEVGGTTQTTYPPLNVWENDDSLFVEAELPGFNLEDLEIHVTGENQLSIKGERRPPELGAGNWRRQERAYGTFSRVFELPISVEGDGVSAAYTNGVLTIALPKKQEAKPRRIEVQSG